MKNIKPETVEGVIKSMEGMTVNYNEPLDLIYRLANAVEREMDELYGEIEDLKGQLGL
jgi:hypothetical protein